ncbi:MAG: hypothetical protein AAGK00_13840 [Pseudomonadota bacterium]
MAKRNGPKPVPEGALEDIQGGGLLDSQAGTFGNTPKPAKGGVTAPYIGETEKNLAKLRAKPRAQRSAGRRPV